MAIFRVIILSLAVCFDLCATSVQSQDRLLHQAVLEDSKRIAAVRRIPVADVVRRLTTEIDLSASTQRLKAKYHDRLARIYLEHDPLERLVIKLKGNSPVFEPVIHTTYQDVKVDVFTGLRFTQAELQTAAFSKRDQLKSAIPRLQGYSVDVKTGRINLDIVGQSIESESFRLIGERTLGVSVQVRILPTPLKLQATGGGAILQSGCTGGYIVKFNSSTTTGLPTAGHCPNKDASYLGSDNTSSVLTFQAEA